MGEEREEPIPLQKFLRYADWFRQTFVPEGDPSDVAALERAPDGYRLTTAAGDEARRARSRRRSRRVPFAFAPPPLGEAVGDRVAFATSLQDHEPYRGRRVASWWGGQGGLESASLAVRGGADVELIVRSSLRWFADREPHRPRGRVRQRLYRLAYPVVGYGPPPLNRLALHPDVFAALPAAGARRQLSARILRAGGSPWLRQEVERSVNVTEGVAVVGIDQNGDVRLRLSDGTVREADAVDPGGRIPLLSNALASSRKASGRRSRSRTDGRCSTGGSARPSKGSLRGLRGRASVRPDRALHSGDRFHGQPRPGGPGALGGASCSERVPRAGGQTPERRGPAHVQAVK